MLLAQLSNAHAQNEMLLTNTNACSSKIKRFGKMLARQAFTLSQLALQYQLSRFWTTYLHGPSTNNGLVRTDKNATRWERLHYEMYPYPTIVLVPVPFFFCSVPKKFSSVNGP